MISLDSSNVAGQNLRLADEVIVHSSMQNVDLKFQMASVNAKLRMRGIQFSYPKLITKERLRSNWFKIKFVYYSTTEMVIENIAHFIRTL